MEGRHCTLACRTALNIKKNLLRTLPDIEDIPEPFLELAIADVLIPSITDHHCTTQSERDLLALPARLGELGILNPSQDADLQFRASMKTTAPLVEKNVLQVHETPDDAVVSPLQQTVRRKKNEELQTKLNDIKNSLTPKKQRAVELASEKSASNWLTDIAIDEMGFTLNKGEFRDALKLRYIW